MWHIYCEYLLLTTRENFVHNIFSGLFAPLTMEGNIFVDGVLASCYADYDHNLSHIAMTPMGWLPKIMEWIFGNDRQFQNIFTKMAEDFAEFCQLSRV